MHRTRTVRSGPPTSLLLLAVALVIALLVALPAAADASAWVGGQPLTENPTNPNGGPVPQIVSSASGEQALVLLGGKAGTSQTVQVATRPPGGAWSALTQLLGTTGGNVGTPAIAMDPLGNAVLAYSDNVTATAPCAVGGGTACLHLLYKPAGASTFTQEKLLSVSSVLNPAVAMDPTGTGNATVLWARSPTANASIAEAVQRTGGTWSGTQTVVPTVLGDVFSNVQVGYDSSGTPVAVLVDSTPFQCVAAPCTDTLEASTYNGSWSAVSTLDQNTDSPGAPGGVSLSRDLAGQLNVIYIEPRFTSGVQTLRTATRPVGNASGWNTPSTVFTTPAGNTIGTARMVAAADGAALAVWSQFTGAGAQFDSAAIRPAGGAFGTPATLDSGSISSPVVAQDAQGNATVAWFNSTSAAARYAQLPHGGSLSAPATAVSSASGGSPTLASDDAGDFSLVFANGGTTLQSAVLDDAIPVLTLGALPAAPIHPGDAVPFTANVSDLWSSPVGVHWDFGDGQTADGASVSHSYAAVGSYNAKAVATDASGNSTTSTVPVTVAAAPITSPGPLPPPVLGISIDVYVLKDPVFIKLPGEKKFHQLKGQANLPNGTVIDTRHGRVLVVIDNGHGGTDSAQFYEGVFEVNQPKKLHGLANIFLNGGGFKGCPKAAVDPHALASSKNTSPSRSVRHLWGSGHGNFRTVGRFASATVRGTTWETDDRCNGTLVKVTAGKVSVHDFVRNKTLLVKAKHEYFANAR